MRNRVLCCVLCLILPALPVAAQIDLGGLLGGLGGVVPGSVPVVDYAAILNLVRQLAEQVAMHQLSVKQLAQLLEMYDQMLFNARVLGQLGTFQSSWSPWWRISAADRYGYNAGWVHQGNGDPGPGYPASVLPLPYGWGAGPLAPATLQRVQYQYSQAELADSVAANTLTVTGGIRRTAGETEAALVNLRNSTFDPSASEVQVLQKVSASTNISASLQNDTNKLLAANAEASAYQAKRQRDEIQAAAADYQDEMALDAVVKAQFANAGQAIQGFRFP